MTYSELRQKLPTAVKPDTWYLICPERHIYALIPRRGNLRVRRWIQIIGDAWGWSIYRYKNCGTDVVHLGYQGGGVRASEPPERYLEGVIYPEKCA